MKKLTFFFLCFFSFCGASLVTEDGSLNKIIRKIQNFPNSKQCLDRLDRPIQVKWCNDPDFDGFWDWSQRTIFVSKKRAQSEGSVITTIVFELQNALATEKLTKLEELAQKGAISKTDYVRAIEKIEHDNATFAATLLEIGVAYGYFPPDASWPVIREFHDHYLLQTLEGHSTWLAEKYDTLTNQPGQPFADSLENLTEKEKNELRFLFGLKQQLKNPEKRERAARALQKELESEMICRYLPKKHAHCSQREKKDSFLHLLFPLIDTEARFIEASGIEGQGTS